METFVRVLKYLLSKRWFSIPLVLFLGGYWLTSCCTVYVGPAEVGMRQVHFGSGSGIHKEPLRTGTHLVIPNYERVHIYPTDLQALNRTASREESNLGGHRADPIVIQTADSYKVSVDATVLYRIHDPYRVITTIGPGRTYEQTVVTPRSDYVLRKALGELTAEEFYQGDKRLKQTKVATDMLRAEFAETGIELVKILVRQFSFDKAYQQQIEQRKIQDQTVLKNRAEGAAAREDAHKREIISIGQAAVQVAREKGASEVAQLLSDATLYQRTKAAEGDLLVKTAQAQGTEMENHALEGAGAQAMVGQKLADLMKGVRVIIVPSTGQGSTNPLNISELLRQFEVK
jgi:regulator of protease activity HflC (stomatin/prohibitin superfamily)